MKDLEKLEIIFLLILIITSVVDSIFNVLTYFKG